MPEGNEEQQQQKEEPAKQKEEPAKQKKEPAKQQKRTSRDREISPASQKETKSPSPPNRVSRRPAPHAHVRYVPITAPTAPVVGTGTCGLGKQSQDSLIKMNKLEYKRWLQEKKEVQLREAIEAGQLQQQQQQQQQGANDTAFARTRHHQQEASRHAVEEYHEQLRQNAAKMQKEAEELKQIVAEERAMRLHRIRQNAELSKAISAKQHSEALDEYERERREAIQMEKEKTREEKELWKELVREERMEERRRIENNKQLWEEVHHAALSNIQTEKELRLQELTEQKRKDKERLDRWREKMQQQQNEAHAQTHEQKDMSSQALRIAMLGYTKKQKLVVAEARQEIAKSKADIERARARHDEQLRNGAVEMKLQAQSNFTERLEEVMTERKEKAHLLREQSEALALERSIDTQHRVMEAHERQQEARAKRKKRHGSTEPDHQFDDW